MKINKQWYIIVMLQYSSSDGEGMLVLLHTFNYMNHCESGQGCSITSLFV